MKELVTLSTLSKTWIFDVDGTIVVHNGHLRPEGDQLLPGVREFFQTIPETDYILFLTARQEEHSRKLEAFLQRNGIRFDHILYGIPPGERILLNDRKPSGLPMAYAINKDRDAAFNLEIKIDQSL